MENSDEVAVWTGDDCATPHIVVDCLDKMGGVELDVCSNRWSVVGSRRSYNWRDKGENGLILPWARKGLNYCNPPYSNPAPFMQRAHKLNVESVLLVHYDATEPWFFYGWTADSLCFLTERVKYLMPRGRIYHSRYPSAAIYHGPRPGTFSSAFRDLGECFQPPRHR